MTIKLEISDFEVITKKIANVIKSNNDKRDFIDIKVERYGIPFKVSISKEYDNKYTIDEISYYGLNTDNIYVTYESSTAIFFGNIFI